MPLISINDAEVPYKLEANGMVTKDDEDDTVFYLGCRAPQQQHLYAAVRNACVRRYGKGMVYHPVHGKALAMWH
jgi:hypothetical protein